MKNKNVSGSNGNANDTCILAYIKCIKPNDLFKTKILRNINPINISYDINNANALMEPSNPYVEFVDHPEYKKLYKARLESRIKDKKSFSYSWWGVCPTPVGNKVQSNKLNVKEYTGLIIVISLL